MRQRLTIILTFVVIIGLLVAINTLTYVQDEKETDSEFNANRSTYHSGPTGTRALHDFLSESGYKVMRWREPTEQLLGKTGEKVSTFVVIGEPRIPLHKEDYELLLEWVSRGGRLVMIDRWIDGELSPTNPYTGGWSISSKVVAYPELGIDPGDVAKMTENVSELRPVQPSLLTSNIDTVMPSRFATRVVIAAVPPPAEPPRVGIALPRSGGAGPPPPAAEESEAPFWEDPGPEETPPPTASPSVELPQVNTETEEAEEDEEEYEPISPAPVVHFADREGALVVDYAYGSGRVVILSDPYVVTNSGLSLKDNLALAINMLGGPNAPGVGLIAFDEYHQGRGISRNAFASYFSGTPVLAIAGQIVLLLLVILWSNGRRFGRPLPLPHVDRRSSLEFVASMAELQERSRAFDLAIENIYSRIRRVLARHAGLDYNSSRSEIAERIATRSTINQHELETLMRQCEDAINGEPITWRQSIHLVRRLRELERNLGLGMRSRDARQAAENI
ncbi:MAG TPA: DUF4350 domain-containing protein [Pyrinomonadaceae bacterium]|nr:DUF4350 domain-containing protein [Pyrinomonadaceae bacterium]